MATCPECKSGSATTAVVVVQRLLAAAAVASGQVQPLPSVSETDTALVEKQQRQWPQRATASNKKTADWHHLLLQLLLICNVTFRCF